MIKVNAVGLTCPMPVIKTKKALKEIENGVVEITIDNEMSKDNLEKMAKEMKMSFETTKDSGTWVISIKKSEEVNIEEIKAENTVFVIASDKMGGGDDELGKTLLKGFIYSLTEMEDLPNTILFYNSGAKVSAKGSVSEEDLNELVGRGVEILTCGVCVDYYGVEIGAGSVTNMFSIIEKQMKASKVVRV